MFNPSLREVRQFFFTTFRNGEASQSLTDLEKIAYSIILEHPEYRYVLQNPERYLDFLWPAEAGETNPFLHLSMHLSLLEQLSIDQPPGIKELYVTLCTKFKDEHETLHQMMDCLAEMIWQAQYSNNQPDPQIYLQCLTSKINSGKI